MTNDTVCCMVIREIRIHEMKEVILELMQNAEDNGYPVWDELPRKSANHTIYT